MQFSALQCLADSGRLGFRDDDVRGDRGVAVDDGAVSEAEEDAGLSIRVRTFVGYGGGRV